MRLLAAALLLSLSAGLHPAKLKDPKVGAKAPPFKQLEAHKGKTVVLEWLNRGCPFVKKHYSEGNMQSLQKKYTQQGVVWLSVVSSAEGKEGWFESDEEAAAWVKEQGAAPTAVLRDTEGALGMLYGAKATPHMFVINAKGHLAYKGAIDDKPSTKASDIPGARNYVAEALDALAAGKKPAVAQTKAYGCSVKYRD